MRLFGLIGYPLTHSFSKKFFSEKFEKEGLIDCSYELFSIASISELPEIVDAHPELEGLNVTIPYKQVVFPFLQSRQHIPGDLYACNCIKIADRRMDGYNTDLFGFENSFRPLLKEYHQSAMVLGNGGATAAVVFVLRAMRIPYQIVSRKLHDNAHLTYKDIDKNVMMNNNIIINTTPLGMYPRMDECPDIPYEWITNRHLLYDLLYNPAETLFLKKGKERGATVKNGKEMLVLQAEESWRIWNQ